MRAPEKIYRRLEGKYIKYYDYKPAKISYDEKEPTEYTRTDAFIEKACSWLKENKDKYLYNTGEKDEYIPTCSGKIIDEFRNYMEGE